MIFPCLEYALAIGHFYILFHVCADSNDWSKCASRLFHQCSRALDKKEYLFIISGIFFVNSAKKHVT